jgi:hypothetical protein
VIFSSTGGGDTVAASSLSFFAVSDTPSAQQTVFVHVVLSDDMWGSTDDLLAIQRLDDLINDVLIPIGGECVGHDIGGGQGVLYVHGPDADVLTEAIRAALSESDSGLDAYAIKRYGKEDDETAREERVPLTQPRS